MKRKPTAESRPKPNFPILQILALEIHSLAFFYIPNLPIRFNKDFSALKINQSPLQWIFVAISFTHLFLHGLISGFLALYFGMIQRSEKEFGWERLIMLEIVCLSFTGAALFAYSLLVIRKRLISSFNELLNMKRALALSGDVRETDKDHDGYGNAMLIISVIAGGFPLTFTLAAMYMSYDTADYVLRMVLNNPMYWDTKTIYCALIIRAVFLFTAGLEISRSGSYFVCCLCILADHWTKTMECMKSLRFPIFKYLYTILRIMHGRIRAWFHWFVYLLQATFFWGTVVASFFVIVCYERVTLVVYIGAIICLIVFVLIQVTLLPDVVDAIVLTRKVVEIQIITVKTTLALQKRKTNWKHLKIAMAVQPINIICGSFKIIDRAYLREHFDSLTARIFDAIMLY